MCSPSAYLSAHHVPVKRIGRQAEAYASLAYWFPGLAPLKAKTAKIEAQLLNEERTFEYVAEQWLSFKSAELVSKSISGFSGALTNHILPAIGKKPVSEIKLERSRPTSVSSCRPLR